MNFFILSAIINLITSSLICFFIIINNIKTKTNRYFVLYTALVAIWAGFQAPWIAATNKHDAIFFMQLALTSALFIPTTFLHFTCHLINAYDQHKTVIRYSYLFTFIMVPIVFTPLYIADTYSTPSIPNWPLAGKLFILYIINYFLAITYSLFHLYKEIIKVKEPQSLQLKYIFWGILITYLGASTNFPLCYRIHIYPYGNIFIPAYFIFITYAILRYQLMDIKIIIKKSLVYSILLTVITLSYFLLIYLTEHILQSMFGYKSLIISMTLATTIGLALDPLRKLIQKIIEKFLFKGSFAEIAEENKLLRQEIIQTEKLKSIATLASGMAHEIKNPLTVLKTFVEYLPKKIDDKAFLEKFTPMVAEEVNRIDNLVHELLDFAKPAIPILKPTHLNNLIDSTLELLSNTALKNKVKITTLYDSDSNTTLNLDYNQMKQALLNIFLNAIDAMPQGGELKIYSLMNSSQIQIKIQDTGIGIDKNDLPHIFDPFYSKKDGGTGLGLSITYEIIKKHGGKIFVESLLKKGTSFIIELPTTHPS